MKKKIGEKQALKEIYEAMKSSRKDNKIRITTMVDSDVLDSLKLRAEAEGVKYQTLLNNILRDVLVEKKNDPIKLIMARLRKLEKVVMEKETT